MNSLLIDGIEAQDYGQSDTPSVSTDLDKAALGFANNAIGFGLNQAGVPSHTAMGLLGDAEQGKFSATKTGINAAKDIASAFGSTGSLIGAGIGLAEAGIKGGIAGIGKSLGRGLVGIAGASVAGPIGGILGSMLGDMAIRSYEEGAIGDGFDARSRESVRDRAENFGWSRSDTADGAATDRDRSREHSIDPGLGSSGYGLNPGLSDMDPLSGYSLGEISFSGYDEGNGGEASGGSSGGHGARGGGNEGDSSPGGIGGY